MSNLQVIEKGDLSKSPILPSQSDQRSDRWISNWKFETIAALCGLLCEACDIIRRQAEVMEQHGIQTMDGALERQRAALLAEAEKEGGIA